MTPQQQKFMELSLETSKNTLTALKLANEQGAIADTIWLSKYETLFDYLESQIDAMQRILAQPEQEPVAKVVSTAPERIWLDLGFDPTDEDDISFHDFVDTTWSEDNATGYGIEYVRADTTPPPVAEPHKRKPLTDERSHQILLDMAKHIETFGDESTTEQALSAECIRFILERVSAYGIKE